MNIFKQFFLSIYSPKSIATTRTQGIGKTILFLFFLTFLSILPTIVNFGSEISNAFHTAKQTLQEEIPDFSIKNGVLAAENVKKPLVIDKGNYTVYFDPTGNTSVSDLSTNSISIALLKNEMAVTTGVAVESFAYSMLDLNVTKADVLTMLGSMDSILSVFLPMFFIFLYIMMSAMKFIGVTILAFFGTFLTKKDVLSYGQIWRMAAYSTTLPTVFFIVMEFLKTPVPFGFLLNGFVSIFVLILAIKEVPTLKEKM